MENKFDIIIIGSGLGGLICGAILSMEGKKVCILEQGKVFGGSLQSFYRKGIPIDTGIHYIGSMREGQIMNQYFKYLKLDNIPGCFLDDDFDNIILKDNDLYPYLGGYNNFYSQLASLFPKQKDGLKIYCNKIKEIGDSINLENHKKGTISNNVLEYLSVGVDNFINNYITDTKLKNILIGTNSLYGGIKDKSSLYHHAMAQHSNIEGAYKFIGGTQQIANSLVNTIVENGGIVLNNCKVLKINTNQNIVESVETEKCGTLFSKVFISAIHPLYTFNMIEDTRIIKNIYRNRLRSIPQSYGFITANIILKKDALSYINKNYHIYNTDSTWDTIIDKDLSSPKYTMLSFQNSIDSINHSSSATIISPVSYSLFEKWENTNIEKRGGEYNTLKQNFANSLINFAQQKTGINLSDNINSVYTSTPLTYRDYLCTPLGSAYGYQKDYKNPMLSLFPVKTKFRNLFLTGQNINASGAIGVALTAATTCGEIIGSDYLTHKIATI